MEKSTELTEQDLLVTIEQGFLKEPFRSEFYLIRRNNFFATVHSFSVLWDLFNLLDKNWRRGLEFAQAMTDVNLVLPGLLSINAHRQYRVALELAFATLTSDAWAVLRNGIESIAHAHKITRHPELATVWLSKNDDKDAWKRYKKAFEDNKKESLFPKSAGLEELYSYWSDYSEWGAHSSVTSMGLKLEELQDLDHNKTFNIHYFDKRETEGLRAQKLFTLFLAGWRIERTFHNIFENRLKLVTELENSREYLDALKETVRKKIIQNYDIEPPTIWPS